MSGATGWDAARAAAALAVSPLPPRTVPLRGAVGGVTIDDVVAERPLPHYDSSAMDGFAVRGAPPWRLVAAGRAVGEGEAVPVVTGSAVPAGAEAVVAVERATVAGGEVEAVRPARGHHVRRAGEEAPAGAVLLEAGTRLGPAHAAVLAIAGHDAVLVRPRPRVAVVLTGDEVDTAGRPGPGRVRDAFDPLLPLAIERLGGTALAPVRIGDDPEAIAEAVARADGDVVVTVGGTGRSPADRLREALPGAARVFDGVAMRPGHPSLLVRLADGRPLLGLPGNPLAAVAALLSFLPPVLDGLLGLRVPDLFARPVRGPIEARDGAVLLVPCRDLDDGLDPVEAVRPNMLRGLAAADVLAVVPPAGAEPGDLVRVLPLPW